MSQTRLARSRGNRIIAGVAGGMAEYFNLDVSLVRLIWALAVFMGGGGLFLYILAWIIIPEENAPAQAGGGTVIDEPGTKPQSRNRYVAGMILLSLGLIILAGSFSGMVFSRIILPAGLIAIGILVLAGAFGKRT
ncbi:MAG: PspC domain-containing protein [Bacillota bacterium]